MPITLDGTTGITAPLFDGAVDAADLTGNVAAARITTALNATGSAPIYACRAWVNFNGTGTVAIRASGNVSSITDNGTGDYTVNFATAMPDANYSAVYGCRGTAGGGQNSVEEQFDSPVHSTTQLRLFCIKATALTDFQLISVSTFR